jgi:hypothetical protein
VGLIAVSPFLPKWAEPFAFALLLSGFMTLIVSGVSTFLAVGAADPALPALWTRAWLTSWAIAFPVMSVVAPFVRRILKSIVVSE